MKVVLLACVFIVAVLYLSNPDLWSTALATLSGVSR